MRRFVWRSLNTWKRAGPVKERHESNHVSIPIPKAKQVPALVMKISRAAPGTPLISTLERADKR